MHWAISFIMLGFAIYHHNDVLMITSGLYAIAGSIFSAATLFYNELKKKQTPEK